MSVLVVPTLLFLSALIVASALGVLVWALGWGVLAVLGGAFVVYVVIMLAREIIADARKVSRR